MKKNNSWTKIRDFIASQKGEVITRGELFRAINKKEVKHSHLVDVYRTTLTRAKYLKIVSPRNYKVMRVPKKSLTSSECRRVAYPG